MALKEQQFQILKAKATRALGTSLLIIPEVHVLVLTKKHVGSGNEIALGVTISGMRHRCTQPETGWAEFGYFLCYFKMVAPRAFRFLPQARRIVGSGDENARFIVNRACAEIKILRRESDLRL